jgi:hypothetical protein
MSEYYPFVHLAVNWIFDVSDLHSLTLCRSGLTQIGLASSAGGKEVQSDHASCDREKQQGEHLGDPVASIQPVGLDTLEAHPFVIGARCVTIVSNLILILFNSRHGRRVVIRPASPLNLNLLADGFREVSSVELQGVHQVFHEGCQGLILIVGATSEYRELKGSA